MTTRPEIRWYDEIFFRGHGAIQSMHPTTLEITKESSLSERGTCIVGVQSTKGCADLSKDLKRKLSRDVSRVIISLSVEEQEFLIYARGSGMLQLTDSRDLVIRKSDFHCPRTAVLGSSAAAIDIPRSMVKELKSSKTTGTLRFGLIL
ncbi:MAG: DUF371 domain-containing protein [Nitrososphaerales archaeon]